MRAGAGLVVIPAKITDRAYWERVCRETGRLADLVIFDSSQSFNWLGFELATGSVESAASVLRAMVELVSRNSGEGGERFWIDATARLLKNAVELARLSMDVPSIEAIYGIVTSAANSLQEVQSEEWKRTSYCAGCLYAAKARHGEDDRNLKLISAYWLVEIARLSDRTRSILDTMSVQVLAPFLSGPASAMCGTETTVSPADALAGKIVLVDYPVLTDEANVLCAVVWKVLTQRAALRRVAGPATPLCAVFVDESHLTALPGIDAKVAAVSRSHKLLQINVVQSLPLLYASLGGGEKAKQEALAWVGNLQVKVFCQNTDMEGTCELLSQLCGQSKQLLTGGGSHPQEHDPVGEFFGTSRPCVSVNFNEQWLPILRPEQLAGDELRKGGPENGFMVDAFVHIGGRRFSNGKVVIKAAFKQR